VQLRVHQDDAVDGRADRRFVAQRPVDPPIGQHLVADRAHVQLEALVPAVGDRPGLASDLQVAGLGAVQAAQQELHQAHIAARVGRVHAHRLFDVANDSVVPADRDRLRETHG
jgi:hypothetical protein